MRGKTFAKVFPRTPFQKLEIRKNNFKFCIPKVSTPWGNLSGRTRASGGKLFCKKAWQKIFEFWFYENYIFTRAVVST